MVYAIPRLKKSSPVDLESLPHKMSSSQARHDHDAMEISGTSAGVPMRGYKEQNYAGIPNAEARREAKEAYFHDIINWNRLVNSSKLGGRLKDRVTLCKLPSHTEYIKFWQQYKRDQVFDETWEKYIPGREDWDRNGVSTKLSVVDRCLRFSKYKDMSTVEKIFAGSKWTLIDQLISGCDDEDLRARATQEINRIRLVLGHGMALRVVTGMRVDGSFVRWLFTDSIVSYLSNVIVTGALQDYSRSGERDNGRWADTLSRATRSVMRYVAVKTDWMMLGYV